MSRQTTESPLQAKAGSGKLVKNLRRIVGGGLRVQVYFLVVAGLCLVGGATAAQRAMHKVELQLGERVLSRLAPLAGQTERVLVNGAEFSFATVVLRGELEPVLAAFERDCHEHSGDLEQQFGALARQNLLKSAVPGLDPVALTTLRRDGSTPAGDKVGEVACALRESDAGTAGILERAKAFAQSHDLSEFGKLRYIRAEARPGSDSSRLLAIWTDDPLNLDRLFPEKGDAAGSDPSGVERPPASRRTFSGVVLRSGDGAYGYTSDLAPEAILSFYAARLPKLGWQRVNLGKPGETDITRAYHRDGRAFVVSAGRASAEGPSDVALAVMEARRVVGVSESP